MNRRGFLQLIGATGAAALTASCNRINSVAGTLSSPANLVRFPEKTEMILLTDRPPQLETPIHYFRQDLTPNEAFFVRWHLEGIPASVDLRTFRLNVSGHVRKPLQLSVDDLRSHFDPVSIFAVNQCSGSNCERRSSTLSCKGFRTWPLTLSRNVRRSTEAGIPSRCHRTKKASFGVRSCRK